MGDLKVLCTKAGFAKVETYIASGNVVLDSSMAPSTVRAHLMKQLLAYAGKEVGVMVRTAAEMRTVFQGNPFADKEPRYTYAYFLNEKPPAHAIANCLGRVQEEMFLGRREIYVYFPKGMGQSKLRIPAARDGTARNMNTVAKLVDLSDRS
jgi:uncharacterized protein (DUF1697 family)